MKQITLVVLIIISIISGASFFGIGYNLGHNNAYDERLTQCNLDYYEMGLYEGQHQYDEQVDLGYNLETNQTMWKYPNETIWKEYSNTKEDLK